MQQHLRDRYVINQLITAIERAEPHNQVYLEDKEYLMLIQYYHEQGDFQQALSVIDLGLQHYRFNSEFYHAQSRIYLDMGEYEQALSSIDSGLAISPGDVDLQLSKVYTHVALGELPLALEELDEMETMIEGKERIEYLICRAYIAERQKEYYTMFSHLVEALSIDNQHEAVLERLWIAVELCKYYEESVEIHTEVLNANPYNSRAWYNLGHAYACTGDYHDSIMSLEYAFLIDPDFEMAYKDCAEMAFQVSRFRQAVQIYLEALEAFGPDMELLLNIGRCYLELEQFDKAKHYLSQAVAMDPFDDESHYFLGRSHFHAGAFEEAIACYSEAIKIEDSREEYYDDLAKSYHLIGEYTLANHYFEKATEIGPEEVSYWFHHVVFLMDIGALDRAQEVLDNSEFHTYGAELIYAKAALQFLRKDKKGGMDLLTEAVEEDASCLSCFFTLFPAGKLDEDIQSLIAYYTVESE